MPRKDRNGLCIDDTALLRLNLGDTDHAASLLFTIGADAQWHDAELMTRGRLGLW
jgi:hypothetical protein